jgi:hypothetical protein
MATRRRLRPDRPPASVPLRYPIRLRVGRARRPLQPTPDLPEDRDLRAHPPVLRSMEHGGPAADGEHLRQRASRLRPPRHLRAADQPKPERYEIIERSHGFRAETTTITINNPPAAHRISGSTEPTTRRHMRNAWSGDRAPWMANVVMPVAWKCSPSHYYPIAAPTAQRICAPCCKKTFATLSAQRKSTTTGMYGIVPQGILGERVKMIDAVDFEL